MRIRSSEEWDEASPIDGYPYRILLAHPEVEAPPTGFPTIYVLDGDAIFATVVEAMRIRSRRPDVTRVSPAVVVGIAHSVETPYDRQRRRYDYTPGPEAGGLPVGRAEDASHVGGGGDFLDFLERIVIPAVASRAEVDTRRRYLFGHSLAGLLALHAVERRELFAAHGAASPSVWWNPDLLERTIRLLPSGAPDVPRPRILITVGEYEERLAEWERSDPAAIQTELRRASRRMVSGAGEIAETFTDAGFTTHFEVFAGENHASSLLLSINRFLPFALGG